MTEAQFETLVRTLEARARRDPRGYRWKVVLLASAGSAYLFAMIVLILAAFAGSIAGEALRERNRLSSEDVFEPHKLPEEAGQRQRRPAGGKDSLRGGSQDLVADGVLGRVF
jgi:hypothetical protein